MKKILAAALALAVGFTLFMPAALADEDGEERVTMGADLTDRQRGKRCMPILESMKARSRS